MKFDPLTLLTTAFLTLLLFGLVLATLVKRPARDAARLWWIATFLLGASGFLLLILVPASPDSVYQVLANMLFLAAYGCCHAGARTTAGRKPVITSVAFSVAVWPVLIALFSPGFETRVAISSTLICAYSAATAIELAYGATKDEGNRFIASALCAAHALFYFARAILGSTFGFDDGGVEAVSSSWGALIALEVVLFGAAFATLLVGITLERARLAERQVAHTDFLTGIGNRRAFDAAMEKLIAAEDNLASATLLLLDLDNFKEVNDRYGHDRGDDLLKAFVRVISAQLADPASLWRLGGDEFAILLFGEEAQEVEAVTQSLRLAMDGSGAIHLIAADTTVSVSIGSAALTPGETMSELFRRADISLYRDKRSRRRDSGARDEITSVHAA
jgi:diguanylate cyclase (GGDEF)-like protein